MRILHLNTFENTGGAAIAARRLHTALNQDGTVISMLGVKFKETDSPSAYAVNKNCKANKIMAFFNDKLVNIFSPQKTAIYSVCFAQRLDKRILSALQPDIIHLHWICGNFFPIHALSFYIYNKTPIIWTFHDSWPLTGGCHLLNGCTKWMSHCGDCPQLKKHFKYDISWLLWQTKFKFLSKAKPFVVALNSAYQRKIRQSPLFSQSTVTVLPNTLNTKIFKPIQKEIAKGILNIDKEFNYILFGACNAVYDKNKGYDLLVTALSALPKTLLRGTKLLVFGASHGDVTNFSLPVHFLGHVHDEITMALAYSAADVFVCPSREENLPNTIMESMACGTPVAGFAVGGIPDMIEHKVNGMLATPHDPQELAAGIAYILEDHERREAMGRAARRKVEENYAYPVVAKQYIELYNRILSRQ